MMWFTHTRRHKGVPPAEPKVRPGGPGEERVSPAAAEGDGAAGPEGGDGRAGAVRPLAAGGRRTLRLLVGRARG